jgi:hypothetical protein
VASTNVQPRLPVGPDAHLPVGIRPIPASSQRPKGTNATIVYARTAVSDSRDLGMSAGAGPMALSVEEGDVVLTQRLQPATRAPLGQNVKVVSVKLMNEELARIGAMTAEAFEEFFFDSDHHFKWCPDGVVNNVDGADPANEYKDFSIANVAVQGFCRFSTLPWGSMATNHLFPSALTFARKGVRNGDRIYLVLEKGATLTSKEKVSLKPYRFRLVLGSQITTETYNTLSIARAWTLGRVVDGNQSKNMVTVCVGVAPVLEEVTKSSETGPRVVTVVDALNRAWLVGKKRLDFEDEFSNRAWRIRSLWKRSIEMVMEANAIPGPQP